ncbi:MAG: homoserine kinase [Bacteroidales bacterium]|nr:homoserine kinase [Bacteroidales bacterium]
MAVKTLFNNNDFVDILSVYDLGTYNISEAIQQGTVQTNYLISTTKGKYVLRYYENRTFESVMFESDLLTLLTGNYYPCPGQVKSIRGALVNMYHGKPYVIFNFLMGEHVKQPNTNQKQQLIQKAAELQEVTQDFNSTYTKYRWNYDPDLCKSLASSEARKINTQDADDKFAWLANELTTLDLPATLPKGICHCDFHFSNVLFQGDEFIALLDFDDANYTYLQFDLVGLIEYWAWPHTMDNLELSTARNIVHEYMKHRSLSNLERYHLFDVYKLSILFDCVWYFSRGTAHDFYEQRKICAMNKLGRAKFYNELFNN